MRTVHSVHQSHFLGSLRNKPTRSVKIRLNIAALKPNDHRLTLKIGHECVSDNVHPKGGTDNQHPNPIWRYRGGYRWFLRFLHP